MADSLDVLGLKPVNPWSVYLEHLQYISYN